jgi:hypothetical protein
MNLIPAKPATKKLHYGILIVCEDEKSNFFYIKEKVNACKPNSSAVQIVEFEIFNSKDTNLEGKEIGQQTDKLMNFAISKVETLNNSFSNGGDEFERNFYRQVYCIGDVDDNETYGGKITLAFAELEKAKTANPNIAFHLLLSNECFEIWYILHFQDITEPLYRGTKPQIDAGLIKLDCNNKIRDVLKNTTSISFIQQKTSDKYFEITQENDREAQAIQRAKNLAKAKTPTDKFAPNPSTDVYILIEMLNNLK